MRMCDSVDPYTLRPGLDTVTDVAEFPEVTHGDIVNYLVYSSSFVTCLIFVLVNFVAIWNGCNVVAVAGVRRLRGRRRGCVGLSGLFPCTPLFRSFVTIGTTSFGAVAKRKRRRPVRVCLVLNLGWL